VERRHPLLADTVGIAREMRLRLGDCLVGELGDQLVRSLPGLLVGLADNEMQPDAEGNLPAPFFGGSAHGLDLLLHLFRWLAPGQIFVATAGEELDAGIRRSAEIERRPRLLNGRETELGIPRLDMLAVEIRMAGSDEILEDLEKFFSMGIALVMLKKDAVPPASSDGLPPTTILSSSLPFDTRSSAAASLA